MSETRRDAEQTTPDDVETVTSAENTEAAKTDERNTQPTLLEQMGGLGGLVYSAVPVAAFVLVNAIAGLQPAIWSAVGVAVLITVIRVVRKEPIQPAISGFFGVAIAAFIAYRTGSARGFFLFGIWASLIYGSLFALSAVVRWPLAGVIWSYLNGTGMSWRKDKRSRHAYDVATLVWVVVFGARFVVQRWLYEEDLAGWLGFAKIAMGYPLFALALLVTIWAVRKAELRRKELRAEEAEHHVSDEEIERRLWEKYS
ncbi:MAG: DUF3159 domain-containing protein [Pseudonocardiaceae bacterium]|nr:DUF3159 domain-containing protein [Pseudonocardiaceae bacterium]